MMTTSIAVFGLIISFAVAGSAQVRTVTNATLERIQLKRLAAERDYRENYARLGFPSPEELDRQRDADMAATVALAEQLRKSRLEKERLELDRRSLDLDTRRLETPFESPDSGAYYGGGYFGGFGNYDSGYNRGRVRKRFRRGVYPSNRLLPMFDRGGGYRVTPVGVYPIPNPQPGRVVIRRGGGTRRNRR